MPFSDILVVDTSYRIPDDGKAFCWNICKMKMFHRIPIGGGGSTECLLSDRWIVYTKSRKLIFIAEEHFICETNKIIYPYIHLIKSLILFSPYQGC